MFIWESKEDWLNIWYKGGFEIFSWEEEGVVYLIFIENGNIYWNIFESYGFEW